MYGMDPTLQASNAFYNSVSSRESSFPWGGMMGGATMPVDPTDTFDMSAIPVSPTSVAGPSDLSYFFDKVRRAKQQAQAEALQRGYRPRPTNPTGTTGKSAGPLDVRAHAYWQGNQQIPVKEIRIWEADNYRNRTYNTFQGNWQEQDLRLPNTTQGKYYRVQVTWENGVSESRDVRMDGTGGQTLDFYHY